MQWDIPIIRSQPSPLKLNNSNDWVTSGTIGLINGIEPALGSAMIISASTTGSHVTGSVITGSTITGSSITGSTTVAETFDYITYFADSRLWNLDCNYDGTIVMAHMHNGGDTYVSYDTGSTWSNKHSTGDGRGGAVDCTGRFMITSDQGNAIHLSIDSGATWVARTPGGAHGMAADVSSGGTIWYACFSGSAKAYKSINTGSDWTEITGNLSPSDIKCSDDGKRVYLSNWTGSMYYSWDSGANFYASNLPSAGYNGVWCTPDGSVVWVGMANGSVYISADCGSTYTGTNALLGSCIGISCDATGSKAVLIIKAGSVYKTTDAGSTWTGIFPITATDGRGGAISYNGSVAHISDYTTGSTSTALNWNIPITYTWTDTWTDDWGDAYSDWYSGGDIITNVNENLNTLKDNWDFIGWTKHTGAGSVTVTLASDSAFTNYNSYTAIVGSDWTINSLDLGSPIASGGTINWNSIKAVKFSVSNGSVALQDWAVGAVANS